MELLLVLTALLQSAAISLGMGGSTFAILNFFAAIRDGIIDESERNLMGIVYVVLRIVMVLILLTTLTLSVPTFLATGTLPPLFWAEWTLIAVLYLNAVLMTKHIMPSTVGPALQASTWYTFGILNALVGLGHSINQYWVFLVCYAAAIIFAVSLVNGVMAYFKALKK